MKSEEKWHRQRQHQLIAAEKPASAKHQSLGSQLMAAIRKAETKGESSSLRHI